VALPAKGYSIEIALITAYFPIRSGLALTPVNTPSKSSLFAFIVYIFQEELPKLELNCDGLLNCSKSKGIVTPAAHPFAQLELISIHTSAEFLSITRHVRLVRAMSNLHIGPLLGTYT
jgi:hypothetical protein